MPFPIYLRRLRFREVNAEITLLVKKKKKKTAVGKKLQGISRNHNFI